MPTSLDLTINHVTLKHVRTLVKQRVIIVNFINIQTDVHTWCERLIFLEVDHQLDQGSSEHRQVKG